MKPTYEELERERNELAAQVERLRGIYDKGLYSFIEKLDELEHPEPITELFEDVFNIMRNSLLQETPPAALAALKAQWQAEAIQSILYECVHWSHMGTGAILVDDILEKFEGLYQRAQEAGDAKTSQQQP